MKDEELLRRIHSLSARVLEGPRSVDELRGMVKEGRLLQGAALHLGQAEVSELLRENVDRLQALLQAVEQEEAVAPSLPAWAEALEESLETEALRVSLEGACARGMQKRICMLLHMTPPFRGSQAWKAEWVEVLAAIEAKEALRGCSRQIIN